MKFSSVIVTGGSGFLGSHLVDTFIECSDRVTVIDKAMPPADRKNVKAKYHQIDVRDARLNGIFEKAKPDLVIHLAAHIHDRESVAEPVLNADNNVIGSLHVFEACRKHLNGRLLFASTGMVYGKQKELPISEDVTPRPLTPDAVSKLTGERYLHFYANVHGLSYLAFRIANIYGPRQDTSAESGVIGIFAKRLLEGQWCFINNDGQSTRDYLYVSDVVAAFLAAAESDKTGVYNLGTGIETKTNDIFDMVRAAVGVEAKPDVREDVMDVPKSIALDAKRARRDLSWKPVVSLEEGVAKTVEWFRTRSV